MRRGRRRPCSALFEVNKAWAALVSLGAKLPIVAVATLGALLSLVASTQFIAGVFNDQAALGAPLAHIGEVRMVSAEELRKMIADHTIQDALTLALYARMSARGMV